MSFGEILLLVVIAIIVVGPRRLPKMMRKLGRTISQIRKVANVLREQSGIDDILREEGIEKEVGELRKLATGRIMDINFDDENDEPDAPVASPVDEKEYPEGGVDVYGALADDDPYAELSQAAQDAATENAEAGDEGPVARGPEPSPPAPKAKSVEAAAEGA